MSMATHPYDESSTPIDSLCSESLLVTRGSHGVVTLTLNRPELHNALNPGLIQSLSDALTQLSALKNWEDLRVLLIRGAGKNFCAGADLNYMQLIAQQNEAQNAQDARRLGQLFYKLATVPVPVVSVVQGAAMGGGFGLVCASDFAVVGAKSKFSFSEVLLGIVPGVISPYVVRKFGATLATRLMLSAEMVSGSQLAQWNVATSVFEENQDLEEKTRALVHQLLQGGPNSQRRTKELIRKSAPLPDTSTFEFTIQSIAQARSSHEGQTGLQSFLTKQAAPWKPI